MIKQKYTNGFSCDGWWVNMCVRVCSQKNDGKDLAREIFECDIFLWKSSISASIHEFKHKSVFVENYRSFVKFLDKIPHYTKQTNICAY